MAKDLKHSLTIAGHRTSLSLEPEFWEALQTAASKRKVTAAALVAENPAALELRRVRRRLFALLGQVHVRGLVRTHKIEPHAAALALGAKGAGQPGQREEQVHGGPGELLEQRGGQRERRVARRHRHVLEGDHARGQRHRRRGRRRRRCPERTRGRAAGGRHRAAGHGSDR